MLKQQYYQPRPNRLAFPPNCYAKCGKQWAIENGLCLGATVLGVAAVVIFPGALVPAATGVAACFTAAQLHYAACLGSCLVTNAHTHLVLTQAALWMSDERALTEVNIDRSGDRNCSRDVLSQ